MKICALNALKFKVFSCLPFLSNNLENRDL